MARAPRWRRFHLWRKAKHDRAGPFDLDLDPFEAVDDPRAALVIIGVVLVLLVAWFFLLPALVFMADLLFLLFTAAIGVAIRVLFRRPWDVVAETDGPPSERIEIPVVGFRASGAKVNEVAYDIEHTGSPLPL